MNILLNLGYQLWELRGENRIEIVLGNNNLCKNTEIHSLAGSTL